ncbi:hypothetical protein [Acinetobacter sp. MB5]|uniref:hypothetical protein n=1 Tax=Acinetobacter sp. MB5 TaxID=2069438 RepID=UPI000DD0412C|nr:hypothetical protein [Acinetobacter sp. MB5]
MFNHKEIQDLIEDTKKLRDQYKQQLEGFKNTKPADLEGEEFIVADAKAQGSPLDLDQIYNEIKDGYEQTIKSFEDTIQRWTDVLSGKNTL